MILYILESSLALLLFYGFYYWILLGENSYRFNRYYLLGSLVFSLLCPLFNFPLKVLPMQEKTLTAAAEWSPLSGNGSLLSEPSAFMLEAIILLIIYGMGVAVKTFRFGAHLSIILRKIKEGERLKKDQYSLVLLAEGSAPFSFLSYCFVDEKAYRAGQIDEVILRHELAHISQKHSFDILFLELLSIFYWFNPIFIWYRNAIKLNHEFLSDQAALKGQEDIISYQKLLFKYIRAQNAIPLASSLHFSLTKKRFQMIQFHHSKARNQWKKMLVVPFVFIVFLLFSVSLEGQTKPPPPPPPTKAPAPPPTAPAVSDEEPIPPPPPPPPMDEFKKKSPDKEELKKWGQSSSYKVWLDGKYMTKKEIYQIKPEDIGWYHVSGLAKNAKDYKRYQYAVNMYSLAFYEKNLSKEALEKRSKAKLKNKN